MKHLLLTILLAICSLAASAQVATFYGVPVDGTPETFVNALRDKGLELKILSEDYSERVYEVSNYFMKTNISIKYSNNLVCKVMMTAAPDMNSSAVNVLEQYIKIMKEDNGDDGYSLSEDEKVAVLHKTLNNGQAGVFVLKPGSDPDIFGISYIVENIDNSRKALELKK